MAARRLVAAIADYRSRGLQHRRSGGTIFDRKLLLLYVMLVLSFLLSVTAAGNKAIAWHHWYEYFLYTLFCLITLATLQRQSDSISVSRLLYVLGGSGLLMLVILYVWLVFQLQQPDFTPQLTMREDNLPLLAPFMLYAIRYAMVTKHWRTMSLIALLATFAYIIEAHGRAALVGLCFGLLAYSRLVLGIRLRYTVPVALVAIVVATSLHEGNLHLSRSEGGTLARELDRLSSYRTAIWRHAINNPPDNVWLGTGMGNVSDHPEILTIRLADNTEIQVGKHLHNFVLDCWYATGTLGLLAMFAWLGFLIWRGLQNWRSSSGLLRLQIGTLLAAAFAILSNALLSYSYGSKQFGVYLFTFLVVAAYARTRTTVAARAGQPARQAS